MSAGSPDSHSCPLLAAGVGAEGPGGRHDHQRGGAGQEEVRAVLARGGLLRVRAAGGGGGPGDCPGECPGGCGGDCPGPTISHRNWP